MTVVSMGALARSIRDPFVCRRGAAAVEFGLIAPILMFLLFGIVEIAQILYNYHIIDKAMQDGVRYLTRVPTSTLPANGGGWTQWTGATADNGKELAVFGTIDGTTPLIPGWATSSITVEVSYVANGGLYRYVANGDVPVIRMSAAVPYNAMFGLFGTAGVNIQNVTQARHIGE